ncbi:response regulator [Poseidonibacter lekithochrous]|uniref:response regulator n=1 Tax=Poseidonibacter lekithochrous TaxID=1904463 RepID=UPI000D3819F7|nr:response regulator [Poseidonibacter lekithochrous]
MFNYAFLKTLDILYVESDTEINTYFSEILSKQFKTVNSLVTGSEALEAFKKDHNSENILNLVIIDVALKDMSGVKLLEEIRNIDKNIPIILTTDKIEVDPLLSAIEYKASDYLQKPINAKDLVFSVERICQNKYFDKLREETQKDLEDIRSVINEVALVSKTNLEGEIIFCNNYFTEITEYTQEELASNKHELIKDDATNKLIYEGLYKSIKDGNIWEGKLKQLTKSKSEFYVYLTVIPVLKKNSNEICEFMWISFLATDDELEQKEFKKKVAKNIHTNRRINMEAREKIDALINKINFYKNLESNVKTEQQRGAKFKNQIKFFKDELVGVEEKLKVTSDKASKKIKVVLADEKEVRKKNDVAMLSLEKLTGELNDKNKSIKTLTKELAEQVKIIEKLMNSIDSKENQLDM